MKSIIEFNKWKSCDTKTKYLEPKLHNLMMHIISNQFIIKNIINIRLC